MKHFIVGITGTSGSGKSTFCSLLAQKGYTVIDADKVSRSVVEKGSETLLEIVNCFGSGILNEDSTLNRKKLGNIVFSNKEQLNKLNSIMFRYIGTEINRIIEQSDSYIIFLDAPQLFEAKVDKICDKTVCIYADYGVKLERLIQRDGLTEEQIKNRLNSQHSDDFFIKNCDFAIKSLNGSMDDVVVKFLAQIQKISLEDKYE